MEVEGSLLYSEEPSQKTNASDDLGLKEFSLRLTNKQLTLSINENLSTHRLVKTSSKFLSLLAPTVVL
jgi:hypothetical protein